MVQEAEQSPDPPIWCRRARTNVLVDCGLFQGAHKLGNYNRIPKKGAFAKLSAVVLTHAHLDHTSRLPLLTRAGYDRVRRHHPQRRMHYARMAHP
jgi:predicted metal-dependent RNase